MSTAALKNSSGDAYVYLETANGSTAAGVVGTTGVYNVIVANAPVNLYPDSGGESISIDPALNGNISFTPKGTTGASVFVNGDVSITADSGGGPGTGLGNLNMENTITGGDAGVINFGGDRFIHNYGTDNIFIGDLAGNFNAGIGGSNTAIGFNSMLGVTTGNQNVAVGAGTLKVETSGQQNTAVGYNALHAATTDSNLVAVGYKALTLSNGCTQSTAVGSSALAASVADSGNTAVGYNALTTCHGGPNNTAVGVSSLGLLTTGSYNAAVGNYSSQLLTTGFQNTAIGYLASSNCTTGHDNTSVGFSAGSNNTGSNNVFIGSSVDAANHALANSILIGTTDSTSGVETHVIRIGNQSGGVSQSSCFIAGIAGASITPTGTVVINASGQLGTSSSLPIAVPVTVPNGGTGDITLAADGVLYGNGTSPVGVTSAGTNGQVLIAATAGAPAFATLTSSGGTITFTTGANTLNLEAAYPGTVWSVITNDQTAVVNNGYICNKGSALLLALPTTSAVGTTLEVTGINTALGWKVTQAAGQQIFFGTSSTTSGATGYLQSSNIRDSVKMVCVVANLTWNVISSVGNITVA